MSSCQASLSYQAIEHTVRIRHFPSVPADRDADWLICDDRLLFPNGQSLMSYKREVQRRREEVIAKHPNGSRGVPGVKKFLDAHAKQDFGGDWDTVLAAQKERLVQAYRDAKAVDCDTERAESLTKCADQGHVQAAVDAANIFANAGSGRCVGYYVEAHNQGHTEALVRLAAFFGQAGRADLTLKCTLLAAHCGDDKSGRICLQLAAFYRTRDAATIRWDVLKEASLYGCLYADFILAVLYRYGHSSCRNVEKARQILVKAESCRFPVNHGDASQALYNTMLGLVERELFELDAAEGQAQMTALLADKKARSEELSPDDVEHLLSTLPAFPRRFQGRLAAWLDAGRGADKGGVGERANISAARSGRHRLKGNPDV